MSYLCPVYPLGYVSGVYTYYAVTCPGNQPSQLFSSYARTCGGCAEGGGPGPDCDEVPPPPTEANAGGPARRGKTLILGSFGIDEDLINRGLSQKLGWNDDSFSENGSIHAMTCRMWDEHHRIWRTCRFLLHFAAPKTPAGGRLPPMFFGSGYELSEETIPAESRSEVIELSQSCSSRLGNHLLCAKVGGIDYYVLTAG